MTARASAIPSLLSIVGRRATITSLLLVGAIAWLDHVTGVEATFVVLTYLIPIALITWFRTRLHGLAIAALATACTSWIYVAGQPFARVSAVSLNALAAFAMFVAMVCLLAALRRHVERERSQRRAAVEQLRHAERLNVIGALAAGVAHELGTPLNVIGGAAEMLADADPGRDKVVELSALITQQTDKITAIIRHLLDFGRRGGVAIGAVDADRVVARTVDLLASTARKHDVAIRADPRIGPDEPLRADARELEQVVSNLVLNGIQAMPRGGVLRLDTRIEQRLDRPWGAVIVQDEGCGIRPADLPYIFDPFFTTKGIGEGTGLGLSVSYGIVREWGGSIEVNSTPGRGSTFTVWIPLARG